MDIEMASLGGKAYADMESLGSYQTHRSYWGNLTA